MCIFDLSQVRQDEVGIIEKFGKFDAIAEPGCHTIWCPGCVYSMKGKVSTRVQQLDVTTDSKVSAVQQSFPRRLPTSAVMLSLRGRLCLRHRTGPHSSQPRHGTTLTLSLTPLSAGC